MRGTTTQLLGEVPGRCLEQACLNTGSHGHLPLSTPLCLSRELAGSLLTSVLGEAPRQRPLVGEGGKKTPRSPLRVASLPFHAQF